MSKKDEGVSPAAQKPLTPMQINALVARAITEFNDRVDAAIAQREAEYEKLLDQQAAAIKTRLKSNSLTEVEKEFVLALVMAHYAPYGVRRAPDREDDGPFSQSQFKLKQKEYPKIGRYKAKEWRGEEHPLHRILENLRFDLVMAGTAGYKDCINGSQAQIDKLFN